MKCFKRFLLLALCILWILTGCGRSADHFVFQPLTDNSIEIQALSADLSLTTVGQLVYGEEEIVLTQRILNGYSATTDGGYRYIVSDSLPGLEQAYSQHRETAEIQGILLYHGFGYLVIEQDNIQSLIPISPNTESTDMMTASEFIEKAKAYQQSHSDILSGGNGLE